ncbi:MAG: two-component system response regulator [Gammaproteobacteria bacterium]|nr:MAG: two-component system response regulator [Gammaproteobacteria bacterium]
MASFLVVDDSPFLADKIKAHVEGCGHTVVGIARDGQIGVDMYKEFRPDIVTLDITMPNKDGHDCLMEILDFDADASAVIISAIEDKKMVVDCLNLGAKGFIAKPLKFKKTDFCAEFNATINDALH